MKNNIILSGFPLSGKSFWAARAAAVFGIGFIDTDALIDADCPGFYRRVGEEQFRIRERDVIGAIRPSRGQIIATGGGSVLDRRNVAILQELGRIVYIRVDKEKLRERLSLRLPLSFQGRNFDQIYQERIGIYYRIADYVVESEEELWEVIRLERSFVSAAGENLTGKR